MKKLYVDNTPEILAIVQKNVKSNNIDIYPDNLTIYCEDTKEKNRISELVDSVRK